MLNDCVLSSLNKSAFLSIINTSQPVSVLANLSAKLHTLSDPNNTQRVCFGF